MELLDLTSCREVVMVNISGYSQPIKLSGTVDDPYFCGKDVCEILGYVDTKDALQKFVDKDDKETLKNLVIKLGGNLPPNFFPQILGSLHKPKYHDGKAVYISESGLYSLILSSHAPFAKEFKRYVTKIILPSIRKYGSFHLESRLAIISEELMLKEKALAEKEAIIKDQSKRVLTLTSRLRTVKPLERQQCIYISTSSSYSKQHRFKVGGVSSHSKLQGRLSSYNGNRTLGDLWFYTAVFSVHDFRSIEKKIEDYLGVFRDVRDKEMLNIHYTDLHYFIDRYCTNEEDDILDRNSRLEDAIRNVDELDPIEVPIYDLTGPQDVNCQEFKDWLTDYIKPLQVDTLYRPKVFDDYDVFTGKICKRKDLYSILDELVPSRIVIVKRR